MNYLSTYGLMGILAGTAAISLVGLLVWIVLVVASWRLFLQVGIPGWKALIPGYNGYLLFGIAWDKRYFWVSLGLLVVGYLFTGYVGLGYQVISAVGHIALVCSVVLDLANLYYLGRSFGCTTEFSVGVALLNVVFLPILAFGNHEYRGPSGPAFSLEWLAKLGR